MKGVGMLVVPLRGAKFQILVSLRVFLAKRHQLFSREGLVHVKKMLKYVYCLCFNMVSFQGQNKVRPDRSLLGV